MSAASVLQDAESGKAALEELEEALEPHLDEVVSDFKKFVKELVTAVFPEKEKKPKAAAPVAKSSESTPAKAKAAAKNGAVAAKGKAKAAAAVAAPAPAAAEDDDDDEDSRLVCRIPNLILMYGGSQKPLLNNTTFELFRGHRYGVVGHNGAGKTTLMGRISAGGMQGMGSMKCYHLQHEGILDDVDKNTTCAEYVRIKCATQEDKIDKVIKDVGFDGAMFKKAIGELSGGWKMRLALACATLQGADVMLLDEPTNHLDTVAIKWLQEFLVKECQNSTAMVISHDAAFLNYICTDVIHFTDKGKLVYYEGNFDAFKAQAKIGAADAKGVLTVRGREGKVAEEDAAQAKGEEKAKPTPEDEEEMKFPLPGKIDGLGSQGKPVATVTNLNFRYFDDTPLVLHDVTCRVTMNSRIGVVGRNGAGKSTLLNLLAGELLPPEDEAGEVSAVWRHRNMRLAYIAQHHFFHLSDFFKSTPLHYMQVRFRSGYDEETQRRLTLPQSPEEEQYRKDMAAKHGKRGKEVETLLARAKKGKKIMYEVKWKGLDDPKQNTYESIQTLRLLGVEKMAAALDDRIACAETALRPLSTREIVKHLEPFGITEHMTCHRMIGSFSAGQKSKLMLAAAMWVKPHIIAFDEPTNYLDFATVRALARAIKLFRGGTIVVTHNEDFLRETCEEVWHVEGGRLNIEGKEGLRKGLAAKVAAQKQVKEKAKLEAEAEKAEKAAAGPSEAEKALAVYLKARQKMGAPKADIKLQGVDLRSKDGTELLIGTEFMLNQGRCYGLVGRNGAGKSTLLREVAYYKIDKFPKNLKVLIVEQEVMGDQRKPVEWVLDSDVERRTLLAEQRELQQKEGEEDDASSQRLKAIADRLEEIGADEGEARATRILRGLQFTDELLTTSTCDLSGGWRMRVSLASALFARPELLLLDEPTNHLDFPAVLYLEEYLASFKNTCMVVSHDRGFLNNVCSDIVFLNNKRLDYYKGNYDAFYNNRKDAKLAQQRQYDAQQREIAHIMEFINKHDLRPKIVAQKESKKKMLDKMEKIEDPEVTFGDISTISIRFPSPGALPKPDLIQADSIAFGYPNKAPLFERATVGVNLRSRVGILGANGAGKSTLLKVMQGKLVPQKGSINVSRNMRVGTFAQHHVDALDLAASCVDCVQSNYPGMSDQEARNLLGRFGINGDMALRRVVTLSGGQKSRIALAIITYREPHLIYLDEPTNHLDMETIDALVEAVKNFEGAVVMVSHDQYFLSQVATEFWSVANGQVKVFRDIAEAKASTYH